MKKLPGKKVFQRAAREIRVLPILVVAAAALFLLKGLQLAIDAPGVLSGARLASAQSEQAAPGGDTAAGETAKGGEASGAEPSGAEPLGPFVAVGRDVAEGRGAAVVVLVVGRGAGLGVVARGTL